MSDPSTTGGKEVRYHINVGRNGAFCGLKPVSVEENRVEKSPGCESYMSNRSAHLFDMSKVSPLQLRVQHSQELEDTPYDATVQQHHCPHFV